MKDRHVYLQHILSCIADIQDFTQAGREAFEGSRLHQAAVERKLQVLAESCLQLSDADRDQFPEIGWQHIRNFRNRLVHAYLDLDPDLLWATVERSLPPLKEAILILLQEADSAAE